MVPWLSPKFLIGAGIEVAVSNGFSKLLDKRELAAGLPNYPADLDDAEAPVEPYEHPSYRDEDGALWLDYVADVGEGFDPTFTVASLLARAELEVKPGLITKRGRALILGGDQVYPSAKWDAYRDRLVGPYRAALPYVDETQGRQAPHLFAIPGNHDWYDGLTSFTRLFTQRSWIGGWKTRQRRSYFAVRLSKRWWLWATDIQFDTYLDGPQLEYFRNAAADLKDGHRVILATAKPSWVAAKKAWSPMLKKEGAWETLAFVEEKLIGESPGELAVTLSGDHHHYAHYERESGAGPLSRITAGGGGAHTMGTAGLAPEISLPTLEDPEVKARYSLGATSPTPPQSEAMRGGVVNAVMRQTGLGWLIGGLYALLTLAFADAVKDHAPDLTSGVAGYSFFELLWDGGSTWSIALVVALLAGLVVFADVKTDRRLKLMAGTFHWLAHILFGLAAPVTLILLLDETSLAEESMLLGWIAAAVAAVVGFLVGRLVFATYLLLVNRTGPKRHSGEIWGGLASTDYKNFLRMKIDSQERLTIYPVGIRYSVQWRFEPKGADDAPWYVPADKPPEPALIEPPIVIEP
jgi:hypothetical protein